MEYSKELPNHKTNSCDKTDTYRRSNESESQCIESLEQQLETLKKAEEIDQKMLESFNNGNKS